MVFGQGFNPRNKKNANMKLRKTVVAVLKALRLNRIAHTIYYRYVHGFNPATRSTLVGLDKAFTKAKELNLLSHGDYYEFGLFKGYSFWAAQKKAADMGATSMRFFGFDSFQGLPEVTEGPDASTDDFYQGQYACSYDEVHSALDRKGIDWQRTTLIRGFFDQSLTPEVRVQHAMKPIAVALIDCDLYSSTNDVLRFIEPLLADESVLVFDDWNCFNGDDDKGQRRALREMVARRKDCTVEPLFEYGSWGAGFLVRSA